MEKLRFPLELKQLDDDGTFVALAAVYGTKDRTGDIIKKGAFTKTVNENPEVPIVWMHDVWQPIGTGSLSDTDAGLEVHGRLALKVTRAQEIYELMKMGAVKGFSIGYDPIKWSWDGDIRVLEEVRVDEVSPVTKNFQAHPEAQLISIKSVVPFQDLPLADRGRSWEASAAVKRVRSWAGAEEAPNSKYRRAFLWYDAENAENFGAYKFPIADAVDGTLTAVPRAIFAAAARLNQADLPAGDAEKIQRHLGRYYKKLDMAAPWEEKAGKADAGLYRLLRRTMAHSGLALADVKIGQRLTKETSDLARATIESLQALLAAQPVQSKTSDTEPDNDHSLLQEVKRFIDTTYLKGAA